MNGLPYRRGDTASLTATPDRDAIDGCATITFVDKHGFGRLIGQDAHLLNGFRECVTIVGITGQTAYADHQAFLVRGRDGDFHPELVGMTRLAFADAFHFRGMQAVEFVLVFRLLFKQSFDASQNTAGLGSLDVVLPIEFPINVAPDPTARMQ